MAMEWPDAAHDAFSGLPEVHRVAGFYILLVLGAVAVLTVLRRWLDGWSVPPPPAAQPVNVTLIPFDQAVTAIRGELDRLERSGEQRSAKIDRLDEKLDSHGERLVRLEERLVQLEGRGRWDGRERRRQ